MTDWEWYTETNTFVFFMHLIITCNYKPCRWRGINTEPGETLKSLETLAKETNLSVQNIRTAISNLKSTGDLTERQHGKHRILKLINFMRYQDTNRDSNNNLTGIQQGSNSKSTVDKEVKKERKKERVHRCTRENFKTFWEEYPRRESRQRALALFIKIPLVEFDSILKGLSHYKSSEQWIRDGGKFIPHASTWLNQERWKDDLSPPTPKEIPSALDINL